MNIHCYTTLALLYLPDMMPYHSSLTLVKSIHVYFSLSQSYMSKSSSKRLLNIYIISLHLINMHLYSSNGWLKLNQHYYCCIENNIDVAESSLAATEYELVLQCPPS